MSILRPADHCLQCYVLNHLKFLNGLQQQWHVEHVLIIESWMIEGPPNPGKATTDEPDEASWSHVPSAVLLSRSYESKKVTRLFNDWRSATSQKVKIAISLDLGGPNNCSRSVL